MKYIYIATFVQHPAFFSASLLLYALSPVVLFLGTKISSFSQADLASRSIQYVHTSDTEKHTDAFTFSVSDGTNEVGPSMNFPLSLSRLLIL